MKEQSKTQEQKPQPAAQPEPGPVVVITVNGAALKIHRGRQSVADIKTAGKVPLADDLDQVVDGRLTPLPDDGFVVLHGQEVFVSHPKSTSSS